MMGPEKRHSRWGLDRRGFLAVAGCLGLCGPTAMADEATTTPAPLVRADRIGPDGFCFGVVADVHHADKDTAGKRHYRSARNNLTRAVEDFNRCGVAFAVQLGDLIDGSDRAAVDVDEILSVFGGLDAPVVHVLGNHDFGGIRRASLIKRLGLKRGYYDFAAGAVHFIVLDSLDVSVCGGWDVRSDHYREGRRIFDRLRRDGAPNAFEWNGGIGPVQRRWLAERLEQIEQERRRAVVFSHLPLEPQGERHTLWNAAEVAGLLESCPAVEAFFCGHRHAERYARQGGVHYVTLEALVEAPQENAYAVVQVRPDRMIVEGRGAMKGRTWPRNKT